MFSTVTLRGFIVRALKPKFRLLAADGHSPRLVLDIGIANDSYRECKAVFPNCTYHGLDFLQSDVELDRGDKFLLRNLEVPGALASLEHTYDAIIVNHVLEHLVRGPEVFDELCGILAPGGRLYVEVPSIRTAYRAKTRWNYHFHDDPTHKRFYRLEDLANAAIRNVCSVVSCGPVSTPLKDLLSLPRASLSLARGRAWGPYLLHLQRKIDHILVQRMS